MELFPKEDDPEDENFKPPKKGKPSMGKRASRLFFTFLLSLAGSIGSEVAEFLISFLR